MAKARSLVFHKAAAPAGTANPANWWRFDFGADWRHPLGPGSDIETLALWYHPVVQLAYADALAFAGWVGRDLPTEAEWEYGACGRAESREYAWGDELAPDGAMMANYW